MESGGYDFVATVRLLCCDGGGQALSLGLEPRRMAVYHRHQGDVEAMGYSGAHLGLSLAQSRSVSLRTEVLSFNDLQRLWVD